MDKWLCFDAGGTFVKYAVINENEEFETEGKYETDCNDLEKFSAGLRKIYEEHKDVKGIAMSMPGMIEVDTGYMRTGGSIRCVMGINLAEHVSALCDGLPVTVENDGKAAGTAELVSGALKDCRNGAVCGMGTGIAGTIIIDRKIVRGANLFAGELSYLVKDNKNLPDVPQEGVSLFNFIGDTFVGTTTAAAMCGMYSAMSGTQMDAKDCPHLFELMEQGDELAKTAITACVKNLAQLLFNLQCVIDPDVIAIGGGISANPVYIKMLQEATVNIAKTVGMGAPVPNVQPAKYRNGANLLGALYFHWNKTGYKSLF